MSIHSVSPVTGEEIDTGDIDQVLRGLAEASDHLRQLYAHMDQMKIAILALSPAERDKTTRLRGSERVAVITPAPVEWDQKQLQPLFEDVRFGDLVSEVLYVGEIRVRAVRWNQILGSSGDERFNAFRAAMAAACKGRIGKPNIKVENS